MFVKKTLNSRNMNKILKAVRRNIGSPASNRIFEIQALPPSTFRKAEAILLQYGPKYAISSNDSLHLSIGGALSVTTGSVMVTSDQSMQLVCQAEDIIFYDPETLST